MKPGHVVFVDLPHIDTSQAKLRPALVLAVMPGPFADRLICGNTTQLGERLPDWDEEISNRDADFTGSGLRRESLIRPGWLAVVAAHRIRGSIGRIEANRLARLRKRLTDFLAARSK